MIGPKIVVLSPQNPTKTVRNTRNTNGPRGERSKTAHLRKGVAKTHLKTAHFCQFFRIFFNFFQPTRQKPRFRGIFRPYLYFPSIIFPLTNYQKYSTIQISLLMTKKIVDCSVSSLEFIVTLQRDNVRRERPIRLFPAG